VKTADTAAEVVARRLLSYYGNAVCIRAGYKTLVLIK